jgi:hypothetical protein
LIVWADYGNDHKQFWKKTYATYQIAVKASITSSGESAKTGAPLTPDSSESFDFTPMDNACTEWGRPIQTTLKTMPDGTAVTH